MTIPASQVPSIQYTGNGVTDTFTYNFKITSKVDLKVVTTDLEGVDTTLTLGIDYTVSGVGDAEGGSITLTSPLTDQFQITLIDNIVSSQETPFGNQGAFHAVLHENAFDKVTRLLNRLFGLVDSNILRIPETVQGVSPELPKPRANALFRYDSTATGLETVLPEEIATSVAFSDYESDQFVDGVDFTAGTTDFLELSASPGIKNNTQVYFDGIYQAKDTYEMETSTRIRFDNPISSGVSVIEVVRGAAIPSDQTLAAEEYANSALASKIAAKTSEDNAFGYESAAAISAGLAQGYQDNAQIYQNNAANYASQSLASANDSANSATTAENARDAALGAAFGALVRPESDFLSVAESNKRKFAGSGFVEWGKHQIIGADVINEGMCVLKGTSTWGTTNFYLQLGAYTAGIYGAGDSLTPYPVINVDGALIQVTREANANSHRTRIALPAAPDGLDKKDGTGRFADFTAAIAAGGTALFQSVIDRQDLVGIEVWHERIDTNDAVYPFGNVQFGSATWNGVTLSNSVVAQSYSAFGEWDASTTGYGAKWSTLSEGNRVKFINDPANNIYRDSESGALIQVRYRVRSIAGLGPEWENTETSSANLLRFANNLALRVRGQSTDSKDNCYNASNSNRVTWGGKNASNLITDNGFGSYSPSKFSSGDPDNIYYGYKGKCYFMPIALVSRRNQGAYHPNLNPNGTKYIFSSTIETNYDKWHTSGKAWVKSISDCFDFGGYPNTGFAHKVFVGGGEIASAISSRPDGKFYDAVYSGDVKDLRISARRYSKQDKLNDAIRKVTSGEMRGWESQKRWVPVSVTRELNSSVGSGATLFSKTTQSSFEVGEFVVVTNGKNAAYGYVRNQSSSTLSLAKTRPLAFADDVTGVSFNRTQDRVTTIFKAVEGLAFNDLQICEVFGDPAKYYRGQTYTNTGSPQTVTVKNNDVVFIADSTPSGGYEGHYYRRVGGTETVDLSTVVTYGTSNQWVGLFDYYDGQDFTNVDSSQPVNVAVGDVVYLRNPSTHATQPGVVGEFYRRVSFDFLIDLYTADYGNVSNWAPLGSKYRGQHLTNDGSFQNVLVDTGYVIYDELTELFYEKLDTGSSFFGNLASFDFTDANMFKPLGPNWDGSRAAGSWTHCGLAGYPAVSNPDSGDSIIPNGSTLALKAHRKARDGYLYINSGDNNATWTVLSIADEWVNNSNSRNTGSSEGHIGELFYLASANLGAYSDNMLVDLISDNIFAVSHPGLMFGSLLVNSTIQKVPTQSTFVNDFGGWTNPNLKRAFAIDSSSGFDYLSTTVRASYKPEHDAIVMAGSESGFGAKFGFYLSHKNGRDYLVSVFKELKWDLIPDDTSEFIDITQATTTKNAGSHYNVTDGDFAGYWIWLISASSPLSDTATWYEFEGKLYANDGDVVYARRWDGDGWGDDNSFDITNKINSVTDDNGNEILVGQLAIELETLTGLDN